MLWHDHARPHQQLERRSRSSKARTASKASSPSASAPTAARTVVTAGAKTPETVREKLQELEEHTKQGRTPKTGPVPTVAQWLTSWLEDPDNDWRYNTKNSAYGWAVENWLIPGLGYWRLDLLLKNADALVKFFKSITKKPDEPSVRGKTLAPSSVASIFRCFRAAMNVAVVNEVIPRSPVELMTWRPTSVDEEVTPLFVSEVKAIIAACEGRRNGTRWTVGMPLGLRQGETLGMPWYTPPKSTREKPKGMDPDGGWLYVRRQAYRRKYEHRCDDPVACAAPHCRTKLCPQRWQHGCGKKPAECTKNRVDRCPKRKPRPGCALHRDLTTCKKVCKPGCTDHGFHCPARHGGIVFEDTKTPAGRRPVSLDPVMCRLVRNHRAEQERERKLAGDLWEEFGLVWCQPNGRPIDASRDREEWKEVLRLAGVRDARIHDGRHTAATLLLLQGIDERTVMAIMGWTDRKMVTRYQHVIDELREEASRRVSSMLYGEVARDTAPGPAKKSKKTKKVRDQQKKKKVDESAQGSATTAATTDDGAKIIPFQRSA